MKIEIPEFHIYSGIDTDVEIKTIGTILAKTKVADGGLRWFLLKNKWLIKKKLLWQRGLISVALNPQYDAYVFLGSPYHLSTWLGSIITRIRGRRTYFWMHGINSTKLSIKDLLSIWTFYKIPTGYLLYGNKAKEILKKQAGLANKEYHVIYNSLNYDKAKSLRKNLNRLDFINFRSAYFNNADLPVVIAIGRINRIKQIHLLLEANRLNVIEDEKPLFNLLIVGTGSELSPLQALTNQLNLEKNTVFFGESYDENVNGNLLAHSDLCIIPGEIGLTAIHALSFGTPVISHDYLDIQGPEIESVVPGKTGSLFHYNDVRDLRKTIVEWIDIYPFKTPELMEECYSVIDQFYNPGYQASVFNSVFN